MKYIPALLPLFFLFACNNNSNQTIGSAAPVAKKGEKVFDEFGHKRVDEFYWMNDPKDPDVVKLLNKENDFTASTLKHTEDLQKKLYDEMVARVEQKYESLPEKKNGYWYYIRYEEGSQYPIYSRKKELNSPQEIMLNVNDLAKGKQIYIIRGDAVSRDNRWLAYASDTTGGRVCFTKFRDLKTKKDGDAIIENTTGQVAWGSDGRTVYYTIPDATVRSYKVMRHLMGTDPKKDEDLYTENDSTFSVSVEPSKDNKYIFISSESITTTESRYLDATKPDSKPVLIQQRQKDLLYYPSYQEEGVFYIYNNDHAKNFKLSKVPIAHPEKNNWTDVIPVSDSAFLESYLVFKNYIVAQQKIRGLTQIKVMDRQKNSSHYVDFGEEDYVANMSAATDAKDLDSIRYSYTSLTTPITDYSYNLASNQKTKLKQRKAGNYDATLYETKRVWVKATDGTKVPVSIAYKKSLFKKDGSNPMLLYGYGSYGYNTDPYFSSVDISLLDRGFSFAIAHIRGGQELGRKWYEDGKLLKKKNTFTDFVDCAQYLVDEKYTSNDKLFANGGSAGGMLMGAVINMRPELFKGVIAEVPWMDVITDMMNPDLPLTTLEYDEWGDPHKKEYYEYMLTWSPYDNVKAAHYPAILATGGLHDTQVPYFSPSKWVAKVRENNTGNNPILFKCNMGAGHSGESGRFERYKLQALKFAFILDQLKAT